MFVLNFMTLYFIFLTFEIYGLMTTLRANFETQPDMHRKVRV